MIKTNIENTTLTIGLSGHIDSANAPAIETEITEALDTNAHESLVLDLESLDYISSAGLRVLLRVRKRETNFKIINVKSDVYEVFEMTGFTEMMDIEKGYRYLSIEGCERIAEGSNGIVYRLDPDTIIKVYKNPDSLNDIKRERELARKALILGIPTAIPYDVVKVDGSYGSVFELLNAKSFSKLIQTDPEHIDDYIKMFVDTLKKLHSTKVDPDDMPSMKEIAIKWASFLKGYIPDEEESKLISLINAVPETYTMIHGDYHTRNLTMQNGEILLIDMDTLAYGHPVFEFASTFLAFVGFGELDPEVTSKFMQLDYETTKYIWSKCFEYYFDSTDEAYLSSLKDKASLIGYTRLLRRTLRREADTEHGKAQIAYCKKRISELLKTIDDLSF